MGEFKIKPKVGLALSGSGSRLSFYIGFLEEWKKQNLPLDYIAACSGGSIVAACYACGTLEELKSFIFSLDKKGMREFLTVKGNGGLYSLDFMEEFGRTLTKGLKFEEVKPLMGFVAVDIENGEQIVMCMGDIMHAVRVSCTLPGIFEPVKWGGKVLIDGGLLSIIPVDVVKNAGIDVVIGVNTRGTKHLFTGGQMVVKKIYNLFKKALFIDYLEKAWDLMLSDNSDEIFDLESKPNIFATLGRSMDLAIQASKKDYKEILKCDLMITPNFELSRYRLKNFEKSSRELYEFGKKSVIENLEEIKLKIKLKEKVLETKA